MRSPCLYLLLSFIDVLLNLNIQIPGNIVLIVHKYSLLSLILIHVPHLEVILLLMIDHHGLFWRADNVIVSSLFKIYPNTHIANILWSVQHLGSLELPLQLLEIGDCLLVCLLELFMGPVVLIDSALVGIVIALGLSFQFQ
jgi:hypothetical protein